MEVIWRKVAIEMLNELKQRLQNYTSEKSIATFKKLMIDSDILSTFPKAGPKIRENPLLRNII